MDLISTIQTPPEETLGYMRMALLLLGVAGLGVLGVALIATLRRARARAQRRERDAGAPPADAWSESARRLKTAPGRAAPPPNRDDETG